MVPVTIVRLRLISGSLVDEMTEELSVHSGHHGSEPCMTTVLVVSKGQWVAPGKVKGSMQDDGSQETIESGVAILFMHDTRLRDDASVHLAEETGSRKKWMKMGRWQRADMVVDIGFQDRSYYSSRPTHRQRPSLLHRA
jgi:hypothetical protein